MPGRTMPSGPGIRLIDKYEAALLQRICDAYGKAVADEACAPEHFGPSPWWKEVRERDLSGVRGVLAQHDLEKLSIMYANFFRNPCGKGLVRRPPAKTSSCEYLELREEDIANIRKDVSYRVQCWREVTSGTIPLAEMQGAGIGNPFGAMVDGCFIDTGSEYHHACAVRIAGLSDKNVVVAEIGGGYGCMARYLLIQREDIRYCNFDVPESLALAAYYLGMSMPECEMQLYGEDESMLSQRPRIILMPPMEMLKLARQSVDVTFSSHALCDLTAWSLETYLAEIARFSRGFLLDAGRESHPEIFKRFFAMVEQKKTLWNAQRNKHAVEHETLWQPLNKPAT